MYRLFLLLLFLYVAVSCDAQNKLNFASPGLFIDPDRFEVIADGVADMSIPTPDANPNTTHPDVIFRSGGILGSGYKYLMVHTPYPFEIRETVCVEVSNDGLTWIDPPGLVGGNPIKSTGLAIPYLSDVDIVDRIDEEGKVYIFFRWEDGTTNKIQYTTSTDLLNWSATVDLISTVEATTVTAAPCIVVANGKWHLWYVNAVGPGTTLYDLRYRESLTLAGLATATEVNAHLTFPTGTHHWHPKVRWDATLGNYVMLMCFTDAIIGNPNNLGILNYAVSMDGVHWTQRFNRELRLNQTNAYRSTFVRTDNAIANGAAFELFYTHQWRIRHGFTYVKPSSRPTQPLDGKNAIESIYGLHRYVSNWYGLPLGSVKRSTDSKILNFFASSNGALKMADSTDLDTWRSGGTLNLVNYYDQMGRGDYLSFGSNGPVLSKVSGVWDNTVWVLTMNGSSTSAVTFINSSSNAPAGRTYQAFTFNASLTSGRGAWGDANAGYAGINAGLLTISSGGNIGVTHRDYPQVVTAEYGVNTSRIRRDGVDAVTGTTGQPAAPLQLSMGAQYTTPSTPTNYFTGYLSDIVVWNKHPSSSDLTAAENTIAAYFTHVPQVLLNDDMTGTNGTLITAHTPTPVQPGSNVWTSNDALWQIQSNKLTRISAGSASPIPGCTIDPGVRNGYIEADITPGGTGGSGLIFLWAGASSSDYGNMEYVRITNGNTFGVIRCVGGALTTPYSVAVTAAGSYHVKVERNGNLFTFYVNGTQLATTFTDATNFTSATTVGFVCATAEPTTTFDNLKFTKY